MPMHRYLVPIPTLPAFNITPPDPSTSSLPAGAVVPIPTLPPYTRFLRDSSRITLMTACRGMPSLVASLGRCQFD